MRTEKSDAPVGSKNREAKTYDAGTTVKLGKAQESSDSVVVYMQESYVGQHVDAQLTMSRDWRQE